MGNFLAGKTVRKIVILLILAFSMAKKNQKNFAVNESAMFGFILIRMVMLPISLAKNPMLSEQRSRRKEYEQR